MKKALHALIIDDEPQVSSFIADVLISDGWKASQAGTAEQAVEMLDEQSWLLIFFDVLLGGADG